MEADLPATPIVALSANVLPEEAEKCAAAGMDDFVGKPAPMALLADKLRRWMPHITWPSTSTPASASAEPGGPPANGAGGVIDHEVLDELTGGDTELAAGILVDYVESSSADLAALRDALAAGNQDDVRRHAHRLKGAARTVGAAHVGALASRLEAASSAPVDDGQVQWAIADELEAAMDRVAAAVASPQAAP
ncbi:MAG: Hpt domain-containing protein [Acidimicrobiales bacterium]